MSYEKSLELQARSKRLRAQALEYEDAAERLHREASHLEIIARGHAEDYQRKKRSNSLVRSITTIVVLLIFAYMFGLFGHIS